MSPQHTPQSDAAALNRREFLTVGGVTAATLMSPSVVRAAPRRRHAEPARARSIIFMVADGMSAGTFSMAHRLAGLRGEGDSQWSRLWSLPAARRAMCSTHSADSHVTDSAAAASAWGIGEKTNNDAVNFTPDARTPTPILIHARQNSKATGVVTTTRVTHATPAGFCVNVPKRSFEDAIAQQLLDRQIDVILGGGARHFPASLLQKHPGIRIARTASELAAAPADGRLLGLFAPSHIPFVLDRGPEVPGLPEMTAAALQRLQRAPEGFVLQIEAGRVDHAAHDNDAYALLTEQLEFDRTIGVVMKWLEGRDDTLLIVTTDHGNANPGLTIYGPAGRDAFARINDARHSFEWIGEQLSAAGADRDIAVAARVFPELVEKAVGVRLSSVELDQVLASMRGERVHPFDAMMGKPMNILGGVLANSCGVAFMSPNHTADLVEVTAVGPGSQSLPPMIDNTQLHDLMVKTLGLAPAQPLEVGVITGPPPKPD